MQRGVIFLNTIAVNISFSTMTNINTYHNNMFMLETKHNHSRSGNAPTISVVVVTVEKLNFNRER